MKKILKQVLEENQEALARNEIMLGFVIQRLIEAPGNENLEKNKRDLEQQIANLKVFIKYLEVKNK